MNLWQQKFPSPCGVCGLKFNYISYKGRWQDEVSVPLRGLWFEML